MRITLVEQLGYSATFHKVYAFNEETRDKIEKIDIGSDVKVQGYVSKNNYKVMTDIQEMIHFHCPKCNITTNIDQDPQLCDGCLKPKQEKLEGKWKLNERGELPKKEEVNEPAYRLFFKQNENSLCFVTFPNNPFYKLLSKIKLEEKVVLNGWRDDRRYSTVWMVKKDLKRKRSCRT